MPLSFAPMVHHGGAGGDERLHPQHGGGEAVFCLLRRPLLPAASSATGWASASRRSGYRTRSAQAVVDRGYIVTNNHVIDSADQITVVLNDRREFAAEVVWLDPQTDLTMLKIDTEGQTLSALSFGDSDSIEFGDLALAINGKRLSRTADVEKTAGPALLAADLAPRGPRTHLGSAVLTTGRPAPVSS